MCQAWNVSDVQCPIRTNCVSNDATFKRTVTLGQASFDVWQTSVSNQGTYDFSMANERFGFRDDIIIKIRCGKIKIKLMEWKDSKDQGIRVTVGLGLNVVLEVICYSQKSWYCRRWLIRSNWWMMMRKMIFEIPWRFPQSTGVVVGAADHGDGGGVIIRRMQLYCNTLQTWSQCRIRVIWLWRGFRATTGRMVFWTSWMLVRFSVDTSTRRELQ